MNALKHTPANSNIDPLLLESITTDVVGRCRELIVACRETGQRRSDFREAIDIVNATLTSNLLLILALIYDVVTRWSATFNMIDRFILMSEVSEAVDCNV
jgi:hypothetical protein